MAFYLGIVFLEGVNMVAALSVCVFGKKTPTGNTAFTFGLVSQGFHFGDLLVQFVQTLYNKHEIQDGFGFNSGDGSAADVVHGKNLDGETLFYALCFKGGLVRPVWIVGNKDDLSLFRCEIFPWHESLANGWIVALWQAM